MLKNFNKNCWNNQNISMFTSISYHSVFTWPPFLFFQHNQQCDTLLPITPCTHKLKAGIAYLFMWQINLVELTFRNTTTVNGNALYCILLFYSLKETLSNARQFYLWMGSLYAGRVGLIELTINVQDSPLDE
jgi:hypothetical protein